MPAKPDLSEFFKFSKPRRPPCRVGFSLSQLPEPEADQLRAALGTDQGLITNQAIQTWLENHDKNYSGNWQNVLSHRKHCCTCND